MVDRNVSPASSQPLKPSRPIRIVAISDTHGRHRGLTIPDGDILIHAGDLTNHGELHDLQDFNDYLASLPHRWKIIIAGNHDFCLERQPEEAQAMLTNGIYLQDTAVTIAGIHFYGAPWQPWFYDWAFNLPRGAPLREKWGLIPENTDVLITHGPPMGILDRTFMNLHVGCEELLAAVKRIKPQFHVFGHIHEAHGLDSRDKTTFINASICDLRLEPAYHPRLFELTVPS